MWLARRRATVCLLLGLLVLLVRASLLPVWPIPRPVIYDEFSYLLQADTFAHGRLTNPPHPLWPFFESIYILQQPTYASKYPPGQALAMAVGQVVFGNPWFGVWLSCGVLAAMLCWALQGWLPPSWALLGGLIAFDLCIFSYWMNSYWGGAVAGIGGALVIGSWARIVRAGRARFAWLFGAGAVILLLTRPYEGLLLAAPAAIMLAMRTSRLRVWLPIGAVVAAGFAWQAFYDYRVTGDPLRMPYQQYFTQYESIPPLIVLPVQPPRIFRHFDLELLSSGWTRQTNAKARSRQLPGIRGRDFYRTAKTMFGNPVWLLILCAFAPVWLTARKMRPLVICAVALVAGGFIELIFYVHYAAPFTAVLLILLVQSLRYLRVRAGAFAVAALLVLVTGYDLAVEAAHIYEHRTPDQMLAANSLKGAIERDLLAHQTGKHVIFVRYTSTQIPHEEWIYNKADIDGSAVIWAQDMGSQNPALMRYYRGRTFWMFEPDTDPMHPQPYQGN